MEKMNRMRIPIIIWTIISLAFAPVVIYVEVTTLVVHKAKDIMDIVYAIAFFVAAAFIFGMKGKATEKLREEYKLNYVMGILESLFPGVYYEPDESIPRQYIADTKMVYLGDKYQGEDYVRARYKNVLFQQSDIIIQELRDRNKHKRRRGISIETNSDYHLCFMGRWMIFDFNKHFRSNVQIIQKGFLVPAPARSGRKKESPYPPVTMESNEFNKAFHVFAQNPHDAFYILTPSFMERIQALTSHNKGKMMFCFSNNKLHIAIQGSENSFEPGSVYKRFDDERVKKAIWDDIGIITQFVDELSLDNNLFVQEATIH